MRKSYALFLLLAGLSIYVFRSRENENRIKSSHLISSSKMQVLHNKVNDTLLLQEKTRSK